MIEYVDSDIRYDILKDGKVKFTFLKTGLVVYVPWNTITTISNDIKEIEEGFIKK
jgi:hypothetical protein